MAYEVTTIADGIQFGEGPVWCPDGTVVCTAVASGRLYRVPADGGPAVIVAETGGGPNACAPILDGGFLVTQNGGIDFSLHPQLGLGEIPPLVPRTPSLQQVGADGTVSFVATEVVDGSSLRAPNDLVVTADGVVWFTDPGHHPLPPDPRGRILRLDRSGLVHPVAGPFHYCNGIALDHRGDLLAVEANGLIRVDRDGDWEWFVEALPDGLSGDGLAVDIEGNAYVCCILDNTIRVFDGTGAESERIEMPGPGGVVTNCCFGGDDGRTLFATHSVPGTLVRVDGLPNPGVPIHPWPGLV